MAYLESYGISNKSLFLNLFALNNDEGFIISCSYPVVCLDLYLTTVGQGGGEILNHEESDT
jgi:hypothetical protein